MAWRREVILRLTAFMYTRSCRGSSRRRPAVVVDMYAPHSSAASVYKCFISHSYIFSMPTLSSLSNK